MRSNLTSEYFSDGLVQPPTSNAISQRAPFDSQLRSFPFAKEPRRDAWPPRSRSDELGGFDFSWDLFAPHSSRSEIWNSNFSATCRWWQLKHFVMCHLYIWGRWTHIDEHMFCKGIGWLKPPTIDEKNWNSNFISVSKASDAPRASKGKNFHHPSHPKPNLGRCWGVPPKPDPQQVGVWMGQVTHPLNFSFLCKSKTCFCHALPAEIVGF